MATGVAQSIAQGQVANTDTAIHTVPSSTIAYYKTIIFHNTNTTDETVVVKFKQSGGTARIIGRTVLAANSTWYLGFAGPASASDVLSAATTTASKVDYTICGILES